MIEIDAAICSIVKLLDEEVDVLLPDLMNQFITYASKQIVTPYDATNANSTHTHVLEADY